MCDHPDIQTRHTHCTLSKLKLRVHDGDLKRKCEQTHVHRPIHFLSVGVHDMIYLQVLTEHQ